MPSPHTVHDNRDNNCNIPSTYSIHDNRDYNCNIPSNYSIHDEITTATSPPLILYMITEITTAPSPPIILYMIKRDYDCNMPLLTRYMITEIQTASSRPLMLYMITEITMETSIFLLHISWQLKHSPFVMYVFYIYNAHPCWSFTSFQIFKLQRYLNFVLYTYMYVRTHLQYTKYTASSLHSNYIHNFHYEFTTASSPPFVQFALLQTL